MFPAPGPISEDAYYLFKPLASIIEEMSEILISELNCCSKSIEEIENHFLTSIFRMHTADRKVFIKVKTKFGSHITFSFYLKEKIPFLGDFLPKNIQSYVLYEGSHGIPGQLGGLGGNRGIGGKRGFAGEIIIENNNIFKIEIDAKDGAKDGINGKNGKNGSDGKSGKMGLDCAFLNPGPAHKNRYYGPAKLKFCFENSGNSQNSLCPYHNTYVRIENNYAEQNIIQEQRRFKENNNFKNNSKKKKQYQRQP